MPLKSKLSNLALYVVIALIVVVAPTLWILYLPERYWPQLSHAWFSFYCFSALLIFIIVKLYWHCRKITAMWLSLAVVMTAHYLIYSAVIRRFPELPAYSYIVATPAEVMLIVLAFKAALNVYPRKVNVR